MSLSRSALLLVATTLALAAPAAAQIAGRPIEVSGSAGVFHADAMAQLKTGFASQGTLGWRFMPGLTLEGHATFGPSKADTAPNPINNFSQLGLDLRWNLRNAESRTVPFLLTGGGLAQSHTSGTPPDKLQRGSADFGIGLLQNVLNQRTYVRLEVRDVLFEGRSGGSFNNHLFALAGLQYHFGGHVHDSDLDGVRDWLDTCPSTPIGAKVDAHGCPIDSDGDKVYDGLDKCPNTPHGCTVDANGCPSDADGDGVCDGLDQCPNTPRGATVDAKGCPKDSDGDGVLDGIDRCPDTPKGCAVDSVGCSADPDSDGVCNGLDHCPNTPAGVKVDANGCPVEVTYEETQLLDTGTIRLRNIQFDTNKATLKPASAAVLDSVGQLLQQFPTLKIEVGGHTDNRGDPAKNQRLSEDRAATVMGYLENKFLLLDKSQWTSKGYGSSAPLAPNTTSVGQAKNRRVEFKVLNPGMLKIEREHRRGIKTGESAPPDTTLMKPKVAPPDTSLAKPLAAPPDTTQKK
jgi:outer membrane protein OmpA-like peptidoglycan-associated protein